MSLQNFLRKKYIRRIFRLFYYPYLRSKVNRYLHSVLSSSNVTCTEGKDILYVRTNLWGRNSVASGAIAHTKGVVEAFVRNGKNICICSPDKFDYIKEDVEYLLVKPNSMLSFGNGELADMEYNTLLIPKLVDKFQNKKPSFIYQRYGLNNFTGAYIAKILKVPFVLEYNGSEIWMSRNWGGKLHYESIAQRIETANFEAADLIVGNAESMVDELVSYGVDKEKICIIPNGVDATRFSPEIDGSAIRSQLGFAKDAIVVSFIGTFGPWHGAEVLAQTISKVCPNNPHVRYLFIGGGGSYEQVKEIVKSSRYEDRVKMIGFVPQLEAPSYLAACDILVSPQIPNPDGTPFFGSPTKLFEYMAMGKAIVASDLDQMGRILQDNKTALLSIPGNVESLSNAIVRLAIDSNLRSMLGANAREEVLKKYTWDIHVKKILEVLSKSNY